MKSNLLMDKMNTIQEEYKELLIALLPKLKSNSAPEALDEISVFWARNAEVVQLYLNAWFPGENSYVFTAITYLDYDNKEHLPFLLLGDQHILDDPLGRYVEMAKVSCDRESVGFINKQIVINAVDNVKILENLSEDILILPLRQLNQSIDNKVLINAGEQAFISLFNEINSIREYFSKCITIDDIVRYARKDIGTIIRFSEDDDSSLSFPERFKIAVSNTDKIVDSNNSDSHNFFFLVYGFIQQAIDVIASCINYGCIPFVRYPVANYYINMLAKNFESITDVVTLCYKMNIAFYVYWLCDKDRLSIVDLKTFLKVKNEYDFTSKLFGSFEESKNCLTKEIVVSTIKDNLEALYYELEKTNHYINIGTLKERKK